MKIGVVGKGGSGKSSLSWLLCHTLARKGCKVVAVDADHNMDLAPSLGHEVVSDTPTIHASHDRFMQAVGLSEDKKWSRIVLDGRELPRFSLNPADPYSRSLLTRLSPQISLMVAGLGSEDVLGSSRCAHGHISPLKYYLPLLDEADNTMVIDGVAGVDMLNFGLFCGVNVLVCATENHVNSLRVAGQIETIARKLDIPFMKVMNKGVDVPLDEGVRALDPCKVSEATYAAIDELIERCRETASSGIPPIERLRKLERLRSATHQ